MINTKLVSRNIVNTSEKKSVKKEILAGNQSPSSGQPGTFSPGIYILCWSSGQYLHEVGPRSLMRIIKVRLFNCLDRGWINTSQVQRQNLAYMAPPGIWHVVPLKEILLQPFHMLCEVYFGVHINLASNTSVNTIL